LVQLVINVEQSHHPQQEHREPHLDAEQIVEHVDGLAGQPVLDPEYLHRVSGRVAFESRPVEILVVPNAPRCRGLVVTASGRGRSRRRRRRRRACDERILDAVGALVLELFQFPVDFPKPGKHHVALGDELRFDATRAQILDVHERVVDEQRTVVMALVVVQKV